MIVILKQCDDLSDRLNVKW